MRMNILQEGKFQEKKKKSERLADSYFRIGWDDRAAALRSCGMSLQFERYVSGSRRLFKADFCKGRLCPMCAWRRTTKIFVQTSKIMDYIQENDQDNWPVFLTLTVRSVSLYQLGQAIEEMQVAWNRLMANKSIKSRVKGWMRALEVTVNHDDHSRERETYEAHPHFHAILMVPKKYFQKSSGLYLETTDWVSKWRKAALLDYDPVCYIEAIKAKGNYQREVAEVAKYCVKDADYIIDGNEELTDWIVEHLHCALAGRRLVAYGGNMKEAKRVLALEDVEKSTVNLTDKLRDDVIEAVELYCWSAGVGDYIKQIL